MAYEYDYLMISLSGPCLSLPPLTSLYPTCHGQLDYGGVVIARNLGLHTSVILHYYILRRTRLHTERGSAEDI